MARVLYFSQGYTPHDYRFLSSLAATEHEIWYLQLEPTARVKEARPLPDKVHKVSWAHGLSAYRWQDAAEWQHDLRRILREVQPDLVHAGPVQTCSYLAALTGFQPLLVMSWGSDILLDADASPWNHYTTHFTLDRATLLLADCQTVVKRAASEFGFPTERKVVFPWGIDLERFNPAGSRNLREKLGWQDKNVLLSVRTFEPLYDVPTLARAFVHAVKQDESLRMILAGSGSLEEKIRAILRAGGVLDKVHFAGQVSQDDLPDVYRSADLYISTSRSDGSSVSLMEALASGLPVLVSDIPANGEWIRGSSVGDKFPTGNAELLEEKIRTFFANPERRDSMSRSARILARQRADWTINFKALLSAYVTGLSHQPIIPEKPYTVVLVQGRMSSSRLPGKVLQTIEGKPMLQWVVDRARQSDLADAVVVATTTDSSDDEIADWCDQAQVPVFRGDMYDVLDRFYQAAKSLHADVVVRVTADCPLLDPHVMDETIALLLNKQLGFSANRLPPPWKRTFPIGLDVEVVTFAALERAWQDATEKHDREHVMPYFYEEPGRFKVEVHDADEDQGSVRWTVDTPADLRMMRELFPLLPDPLHARWCDVLQVWQMHPLLQRMNADVQHKKFDDVDARFGDAATKGVTE
ncbi:MAG TPA: glycosyltransferase [Bellilinea sp.]|nr:glycosyltransferase [Bellilinea sp.]